MYLTRVDTRRRLRLDTGQDMSISWNLVTDLALTKIQLPGVKQVDHQGDDTLLLFHLVLKGVR